MDKDTAFILVLIATHLPFLILGLKMRYTIKANELEIFLQNRRINDELWVALQLARLQALHFSQYKGPKGPVGVRGPVHYVKPGVTILGPEK